MITLTLLDEVNCEFSGLSNRELKTIQSKLSYMKEGAFMMAAYQTGHSDGKECLFEDDGLCFQYHIDIVLDVLENEFGYDLTSDVKLLDERPTKDLDIDISLIDNQWLVKETGKTLREQQVDSVNNTIKYKKGIIDAATSSGKTLICLAISKAYDHILPSLVIVPTELLLNQTIADYKLSNLSCCAITASTPKKKRKELVDSHRHVIITTKLFLNEAALFDQEAYVVMVDETHVFGDQFAYAMRTTLNNCPIRIGLTASLPQKNKNRLKHEKIKCHIGGDEIIKVPLHELISDGYASKLSIEVIKTTHKSIEDHERELEKRKLWSIEKENAYMDTNKERIEAVAYYIKSLPKTNTLVLCRPAFGNKLAEFFDSTFIDDSIKKKDRMKLLNEFDTKESDDHYVFASFGTVSTGISVNKIFRVIIIDAGKSLTYTIQSIGRGARLDGEHNEFEIKDIGTNCKYGKKHRKDRISVYKKQKFPYTVGSDIVIF